MPATLTPPKTAKRKPAVSQGLKRVATPKKTTATIGGSKPVKSVEDIAKELAKNPPIYIDEKDRELIYGTNMMSRLMQEEKL